MTAFATFDSSDWAALSGAEAFEDGADPLVCWDIKVDGLDTMAVIDGNGFYLAIYTPDGETVGEVAQDRDNSAPLFRFLATLKAEYTTGELTDMGLAPVRP